MDDGLNYNSWRQVSTAFVRRRRIALIVFTIIVSCGVFSCVLAKPTYKANTYLLCTMTQPRVAMSDIPIVAQALAGITPLSVETYVSMLNNTYLNDSDFRKLPANIRHRINTGYTFTFSASQVSNSELILVSCTASDKEVATVLVNAYSAAFIRSLRERNEQLVNKIINSLQQKVDSAVRDSEIIRTELAGNADRSKVHIAETSGSLAEVLLDRSKSIATGKNGVPLDRLEASEATSPNPTADDLIRARENIRTLKQQINNLKVIKGSDISQLSVVTPSITASPQSSKRSLIVAFVLGAILSVGIPSFLEKISGNLYSAREIENITDLATLASIPISRDAPDIKTDIELDQDFQTPQEYRLLARSLLSLARESSIRSIALTSAVPLEDKPIIVLRLAMALIEQGRDVLVVDGNFENPTIHHTFNLSNDQGLSSLLRQGTQSTELMFETKIPGLRVLPSGPPIRTHTGNLHCKPISFGEPSIEGAQHFVLFDCPCIERSSNAIDISEITDATVLIVSAQNASEANLRQAVNHLKLVTPRLLGTVITEVDSHFVGA